MTWYLDNVYKRNEEAPYTFYVPSKQVIERLEVGDAVKLMFVGEIGSGECAEERMWVTIIQRDGDNFKGELDNEPYELTEVVNGQEITFQVEHICDTEYDDPDASKWDYYFDTKVIVSNDVLEREEFNFMLRDYPDGEYDSGWTMFSGYEEDEFNSNPANFQYISLGVMLNIDDSILSLIEEEPLCVFERSEEGTFLKVDEYDWESYLNG